MNKTLLQALAISLLFSPSLLKADSKNMADYTLRLHVYSKDSTTFYSRMVVEESKGEGRANLFDNGDVRGIDFNFSCDEKLRASFGYETYPARWKKPGQVLTVLLPVFGKSNTYFTCNLNTAVKDFVYTRHNGRMSSEAPERYKLWMAKHDYDPVHGKNLPVNLEATDSEPGKEAPPAPPQ